MRVQQSGMGASSYQYELAGELYDGRGTLQVAGRKIVEEEEGAERRAETRTTGESQYRMEQSGQRLEGDATLRRQRRYESETSVDYEDRAGQHARV